MKIGFISDTHGDLTSWQEAIEMFVDCDYIIHCGDILSPGPFNQIPDGFDPLGLAEMINKSDIPILIAKGNCDAEVDTLAIKLPIQSPYLLFRWENVTLLAQHGHLMSMEDYQELLSNYKTNIAVSGHTHEFFLEKQENLVILNPGSPAIPKGEEIPTIAILEDYKLSLFDLRSKKSLKSVKLYEN